MIAAENHGGRSGGGDLVERASELFFCAGPVEGVGVEVTEVKNLGATGTAHAVAGGDFNEVGAGECAGVVA